MTGIDTAWMATLSVGESGRGVTSRAPWKAEHGGKPVLYATDGWAALFVEMDGEFDREPSKAGQELVDRMMYRAPRGGHATMAAIRAWATPGAPTSCTRCRGAGTWACGACRGTGRVVHTRSCDDCDHEHECEEYCDHCDRTTHMVNCPSCDGGLVHKKAIRVGDVALDPVRMSKFTAGLPGGDVRVHASEVGDAVEFYGDGWRLFVMPLQVCVDDEMANLEVAP